ncbi:hypothetical protein HZU77_013445 [Neisseriaceae bacterium TC5R-5]|nr:hypothetical protein [Neisseriaceae bacterium TC5R-5]
MKNWVAVALLLLFNQAIAATAQDAKKYISDLDAAMKSAEPVLKQGDLKTVSQFSQRMSKLQQAGAVFGSSVFDQPYGYCFSAGINAQTWWQAKLKAATKGKEPTLGAISFAWKNFQTHRSECLKVAKAGSSTKGTEQIESTSETPPRKGCLKVLGVRPDGKVGTIAYTCPKT